MFKALKKRDSLLQKFRQGVSWLNKQLLNRGHTLHIDQEIERFEREVIAPLDKEFSQ